jgi:hypothetical protein
MTDREDSTPAGSKGKTSPGPRKRRRTVSIGGTSQSAFAGYATRAASNARTRKSATSAEDRRKQDKPEDT